MDLSWCLGSIRNKRSTIRTINISYSIGISYNNNNNDNNNNNNNNNKFKYGIYQQGLVNQLIYPLN